MTEEFIRHLENITFSTDMSNEPSIDVGLNYFITLLNNPNELQPLIPVLLESYEHLTRHSGRLLASELLVRYAVVTNDKNLLLDCSSEDYSNADSLLSYVKTVQFTEGLSVLMPWYDFILCHCKRLKPEEHFNNILPKMTNAKDKEMLWQFVLNHSHILPFHKIYLAYLYFFPSHNDDLFAFYKLFCTSPEYITHAALVLENLPDSHWKGMEDFVETVFQQRSGEHNKYKAYFFLCRYYASANRKDRVELLFQEIKEIEIRRKIALHFLTINLDKSDWLPFVLNLLMKALEEKDSISFPAIISFIKKSIESGALPNEEQVQKIIDIRNQTYYINDVSSLLIDIAHINAHYEKIILDDLWNKSNHIGAEALHRYIANKGKDDCPLCSKLYLYTDLSTKKIDDETKKLLLGTGTTVEHQPLFRCGQCNQFYLEQVTTYGDYRDSYEERGWRKISPFALYEKNATVILNHKEYISDEAIQKFKNNLYHPLLPVREAAQDAYVDALLYRSDYAGIRQTIEQAFDFDIPKYQQFVHFQSTRIFDKLYTQVELETILAQPSHRLASIAQVLLYEIYKSKNALELFYDYFIQWREYEQEKFLSLLQSKHLFEMPDAKNLVRRMTLYSGALPERLTMNLFSLCGQTLLFTDTDLIAFHFQNIKNNRHSKAAFAFLRSSPIEALLEVIPDPIALFSFKEKTDMHPEFLEIIEKYHNRLTGAHCAVLLDYFSNTISYTYTTLWQKMYPAFQRNAQTPEFVAALNRLLDLKYGNPVESVYRLMNEMAHTGFNLNVHFPSLFTFVPGKYTLKKRELYRLQLVHWFYYEREKFDKALSGPYKMFQQSDQCMVLTDLIVYKQDLRSYEPILFEALNGIKTPVINYVKRMMKIWINQKLYTTDEVKDKLKKHIRSEEQLKRIFKENKWEVK